MWRDPPQELVTGAVTGRALEGRESYGTAAPVPRRRTAKIRLITARTRRIWTQAPMEAPETRPNTHNTSRMTVIVQSIAHLLSETICASLQRLPTVGRPLRAGRRAGGHPSRDVVLCSPCATAGGTWQGARGGRLAARELIELGNGAGTVVATDLDLGRNRRGAGRRLRHGRRAHGLGALPRPLAVPHRHARSATIRGPARAAPLRLGHARPRQQAHRGGCAPGLAFAPAPSRGVAVRPAPARGEADRTPRLRGFVGAARCRRKQRLDDLDGGARSPRRAWPLLRPADGLLRGGERSRIARRRSRPGRGASARDCRRDALRTLRRVLCLRRRHARALATAGRRPCGSAPAPAAPRFLPRLVRPARAPRARLPRCLGRGERARDARLLQHPPGREPARRIRPAFRLLHCAGGAPHRHGSLVGEGDRSRRLEAGPARVLLRPFALAHPLARRARWNALAHRR